MSAANLDSIFAALADPTRRAIVARLATGEATVLELAAPFEISLPAISRHLKVLERAGLISRGRDAQRRPCQLREAWSERFEQLDDYLKKLQAKPPKEKNNNGRKKS